MALTSWKFNPFMIELRKRNEIMLQHPFVILREWILACSVIVITMALTTTLKSIFKKLSQIKKWGVIKELLPFANYLLWILGLKISIALAPLGPKLENGLNASIYVLAVTVVSIGIRRAALLGFEWSALKTRDVQTLKQGFLPLIKNMVTLFVFLSSIIMILKHFNYDVMSLITALGVGSLAVGLAAKDTLSHMISGFVLIIDGNFGHGDRINLNGLIGEIEQIGLRSTLIKLDDGNQLIVPNSELVNTRIINFSLPPRETLATISIRAPYSLAFNKIKSLSLSVLQLPEFALKIHSPAIHLRDLSEGHQLLQLSFWVKDTHQTKLLTSEFNQKLLAQLQEEGISLIETPPLKPSGP